MSAARRSLWNQLRLLKGVRFCRAHPVGAHTAEFACPEARLAVEIDDGQSSLFDFDVHRSADLQAAGWTLLRLPQQQVVQNPDAVHGLIAQALGTALRAAS